MNSSLQTPPKAADVVGGTSLDSHTPVSLASSLNQIVLYKDADDQMYVLQTSDHMICGNAT